MALSRRVCSPCVAAEEVLVFKDTGAHVCGVKGGRPDEERRRGVGAGEIAKYMIG